MAIKKACSVITKVKNTGKECDTSMLAPSMILALKGGTKITEAELQDPVAWATQFIHERKMFPLFGQKAPIRELSNNSEGDVKITLDDGLEVFVKYGLYRRTLSTTSGGLCYAQALQSFGKSGYDLIEIDATGQMLVRKNSDGTYGGLLIDSMYAPSPILADIKTTVYKNRFEYSFSPTEMVNNGCILEGAEQLLSMTGLIDAKFAQSSLASSATTICFKVITECSEENLADVFGVSISDVSNYVVVKASDNSVVGLTTGTVTQGSICLNGVFVSGVTYRVTATKPDFWLANQIEGYDANTNNSFLEITV